jgi:hypothetical protein
MVDRIAFVVALAVVGCPSRPAMITPDPAPSAPASVARPAVARACGTTVETVVSPTRVSELAVAGDAIYWSGDGIWTAPKSGGTARLFQKTALHAHGLVPTSQELYWIEYGAVFAKPFGTGDARKIAGGDGPSIALVLGGDRLFASRLDDDAVTELSLDGAKRRVVFRGSPAKQLVADAAGAVFWDIAGRGLLALHSVDDAGASRKLWSGEGVPAPITLDATAIYFASTDRTGGVIRTADRNGGGVRTFANAAVSSLALDARHLYVNTYGRITAFPRDGGAPKVLHEPRGEGEAALVVLDAGCLYFSGHGRVQKVAALE